MIHEVWAEMGVRWGVRWESISWVARSSAACSRRREDIARNEDRFWEKEALPARFLLKLSLVGLRRTLNMTGSLGGMKWSYSTKQLKRGESRI